MRLDIFADLLMTSDVILPIFGLSLLVSALIVWIALKTNRWLTSRQPNCRMSPEEQALSSLFAEEEISRPARMRMDILNRGADAPSRPEAMDKVTNTPYSDTAAKYGFETYKHHDFGEVLLVDTLYPLLDIKERLYSFPLHRLVNTSPKKLHDTIRIARRAINRHADRAGITVTRRRVGRPSSKGVVYT